MSHSLEMHAGGSSAAAVRTRRSLGILVCATLLSWASFSSAAEPAPPGAVVARASVGPEGAAAARSVVEAFHEVLLDCMRNADALGFQGRFERILAAQDAAFDLPFMARMAVGGTWNELSDQQRAEVVSLSQRLSATRYADNFDSYADQRLETRSEQPAARGTILVSTVLVQPNDRDVTFDYRLRKTRGEWRIIDVMLDGMVSELTHRRAQYRSLIERKGYDELLAVMESKIQELSQP